MGQARVRECVPGDYQERNKDNLGTTVMSDHRTPSELSPQLDRLTACNTRINGCPIRGRFALFVGSRACRSDELAFFGTAMVVEGKFRCTHAHLDSASTASLKLERAWAGFRQCP